MCHWLFFADGRAREIPRPRLTIEIRHSSVFSGGADTTVRAFLLNILPLLLLLFFLLVHRRVVNVIHKRLHEHTYFLTRTSQINGHDRHHQEIHTTDAGIVFLQYQWKPNRGLDAFTYVRGIANAKGRRIFKVNHSEQCECCTSCLIRTKVRTVEEKEDTSEYGLSRSAI